jgi:thiamine pyrophosphate-dependent acetolactate synthase large subunit-like protein
MPGAAAISPEAFGPTTVATFITFIALGFALAAAAAAALADGRRKRLRISCCF